MTEIKFDETKEVAASSSSKASQDILIEALASAKNYTMKVTEAVELLYPNDKRNEAKIKASFASVKNYCWSKNDIKVEYTDSTHTSIKILGKRKAGTNLMNPVK